MFLCAGWDGVCTRSGCSPDVSMWFSMCYWIVMYLFFSIILSNIYVNHIYMYARVWLCTAPCPCVCGCTSVFMISLICLSQLQYKSMKSHRTTYCVCGLCVIVRMYMGVQTHANFKRIISLRPCLIMGNTEIQHKRTKRLFSSSRIKTV